MTQTTLSPTIRALLWTGFLASLSAMDFTYTAIALAGLPGAGELNPIAAYAFDVGLVLAAGVKIVALATVLGLAVLLSRTTHARQTERVLAAWCVILLAVNSWSALQLLGAA